MLLCDFMAFKSSGDERGVLQHKHACSLASMVSKIPLGIIAVPVKFAQ